jgi:hypothetical protein
VAVLALRDGGAPPRRAGPTPTPTPTPTPAPPAATAGSLAIGITEPNPAFVATTPAPEPFERWRGALEQIRPSLYRMVVDWPILQPGPESPPKVDVPINGCMRTLPPCAPWNGLRDQLRALAARQRDDPGRWEALVVITGTPEWAAVRCGSGESAAPRDLDAYRGLIRAVSAEAAAQGARLRYWSPWNEANHPYFLAPQRRGCADPPGAYARLARALGAALQPGQELVLGELAGLHRRTPNTTTVREFVAGLPRDVVCASPIWGQHAYVGGRDPVDDLAGAIARFGCDAEPAIWITETGAGAGGPGPGEERTTTPAKGCRRMAARLERWYRDPRVAAAFQYTLREDDTFPTGLVTTALDRAYPALGLWQAWGAREDPADPPPRGETASSGGGSSALCG